jgi:hypothetical protein
MAKAWLDHAAPALLDTPNVPVRRAASASPPVAGSVMLMDCECCWTHSIPIEDCDGDNCPLCGSSMLMEQGDLFDAAVWGRGHNRAYGKDETSDE